jgi:hypothetical protein
MQLLDQLSTVSRTYCAAVGISRARVATIIFNHGAKFDLIDQGRDINTRTFETAMAWFSANWPDGLDWPEGIDRPASGSSVTAAQEATP